MNRNTPQNQFTFWLTISLAVVAVGFSVYYFPWDAGAFNLGALAMASDELGYVVVSDENFLNHVIAFDAQAGSVLRELRTSSSLIPEIEIDGAGVLAIPDRNALEPKLCLYRVPDEASASETFIWCAALDLPPFSVEALD